MVSVGMGGCCHAVHDTLTAQPLIWPVRMTAWGPSHAQGLNMCRQKHPAGIGRPHLAHLLLGKPMSGSLFAVCLALSYDVLMQLSARQKVRAGDGHAAE